MSKKNRLFTLGRLLLFLTFVLSAAFLTATCGGGSVPKAAAVYKVYFNADGGEPVPETQLVPEGGKVEAPEAMTKTKSSFRGWYKDLDGEEPWDFDGDVVEHDTFLFAVWGTSVSKGGGGGGSSTGGGPTPAPATTYNIDMQNDGNGTASASPSNAAQGATVTITAVPGSGYKFKEWQPVSGGITLASDTTSPTTFTMPANNVAIKSLFELDTYTVTFNSNGGGPAPAAQTVSAGSSITLPGQESMAKTDFTFAGWMTTGTVGTGLNYGRGVSYTSAVSTTLYARWISLNPGDEMVKVNAGSFTMGSDLPYSGTYSESPAHLVTLTKGYYMGRYTVTQAQYQLIMGSNPSNFPTGDEAPNRPVELVSWYDAIVFCNKLSDKEGLTPVYSILVSGSDNYDPDDWGAVPTSNNAVWNAAKMDPGATGYRLPTEAEWEYACHAGTTTRWSFGDTDVAAGDYMWYSLNSGGTTHEVGQKLANSWGLYDMDGNVMEWCWDWAANYTAGPVTDPTGGTGTLRVMRSLTYGNAAAYSTFRLGTNPQNQWSAISIRLVRPL